MYYPLLVQLPHNAQILAWGNSTALYVQLHHSVHAKYILYSYFCTVSFRHETCHKHLNKTQNTVPTHLHQPPLDLEAFHNLLTQVWLAHFYYQVPSWLAYATSVLLQLEYSLTIPDQ